MLEVKFADEGGFGDGVTQSFYTAVAAELTERAPSGPSPLCGVFRGTHLSSTTCLALVLFKTGE